MQDIDMGEVVSVEKKTTLLPTSFGFESARTAIFSSKN